MKADKYILIFTMVFLIAFGLFVGAGCDDDDDDDDDGGGSLCPVQNATLHRVTQASFTNDCEKLGITFIFEGFYFSEENNLYGLKGQYSIDNHSSYFLKGELEDLDEECFDPIYQAGTFEVFTQYSEETDEVNFEVVSATTSKAQAFCDIEISLID